MLHACQDFYEMPEKQAFPNEKISFLVMSTVSKADRYLLCKYHFRKFPSDRLRFPPEKPCFFYVFDKLANLI